MALLCAVALGQSIPELLQDLSAADPEKVERARRALIDAENAAVQPLKDFLSGSPPARAAEQARWALNAIGVRKRLTREVLLRNPWVEERIAAGGTLAIQNLLARMYRERKEERYAVADYEAVGLLLLERNDLAGEAKDTLLTVCAVLRCPVLAARLASWLRSPDGDLRERTAAAIVQSGSREAAREVAAILKEKDPDVRACALRVLGHLRATEVAGSVVPLLEDPVPSVRARAVTVLGLLGHREAAPKLAAALRDGDEGVREAAAAALVDLRAVELVPEVVALLAPSQPMETRRVALKLLAHLGDPRAGPGILALLSEKDTALRQAAVVALGRVRAREAAEPLVNVLLEDPSCRDLAAGALANLGLERAPPLLIQAIRHEDDGVRTAALHVLRTLKAEALAGALSEDRLAADAAAVLSVTQPPDARRVLQELAAKGACPAPVAVLRGQLGDRDTGRFLLETARGAGEWQAAARVALLGLGDSPAFSRLARLGIRRWKLSGTLQEMIDTISSESGIRFIVSDRVPPEQLSKKVEVHAVLTGEEALRKAVAAGELGLLADEGRVRIVPAAEAISFWEKRLAAGP